MSGDILKPGTWDCSASRKATLSRSTGTSASCSKRPPDRGGSRSRSNPEA